MTALTGGEASQAYAFSIGDRRLVLRVNRQFSYRRDAWASRKFVGTVVPAPRVGQTGQAGPHFWAMSEMALGTMLANLPLDAVERVTAGLVQTLAAIHETPVHDSTGYGYVDESGNAGQASWRGGKEVERRPLPPVVIA